VRFVLERGRSENGLFSARVMWGTMEELTKNLRSIGLAGSDRSVLTQVFGKTKFVYLGRHDAVAQAISRLRAEQSSVWHIEGDQDQAAAEDKVHYDRRAIQYYIDESVRHNSAWSRWFQNNQIVPLRLSYEDLASDGVSQAYRILDFVGVAPPNFLIRAPNVRMADNTSEEWARRFRIETGFID